MQRQRPIGVFDSGVGGLTVVAALRRRLPAESILYLGDTARLPYGTKSKDTVARYTRRNLEFLEARGVKVVVVACNTASALGLGERSADEGNAGESLPVWGVIEPGARAAAQASRGHLGVIATESTVDSGAYQAALERVRPELRVTVQACPLFVPLVEEGWADDPVAEQVAARYLEPLLQSGVDTLLLGCTHYPVLAPVLAKVAGPDVALVDSAQTIANSVAFRLDEMDLAAPGDANASPPPLQLCATDGADRFVRIARSLLGPADPADDSSLTFEWVEVT